VPFREKGVPSVQQIEDKTSDFNRYYHQAGDTVDHMDSAYWHAMMRGLVATIATWAGVVPAVETTATPPPTRPTGPSITPPPSTTPLRPPSATPAPSATAVLRPRPLLLPLAYRSTR
jgi:hypothetical protein